MSVGRAGADDHQIGGLYEHTGTFAAGPRSLRPRRNSMSDYISHEKGGVLGPASQSRVATGDGQSRPRFAINERIAC